MDPFSVTAGVAGLLSLSLQISQILTNYIDSVKNAPKEAKELAAKLTALISVLEQLERFVEKHVGTDNFKESSILYRTTKRCSESLEHLHLTLTKFISSSSGDSSTWRRFLKWPLTKDKHQQTVTLLHEYLEIFDLSTSLDGLTLAAKTAEEVRHFGTALSGKINNVLSSMQHLASSMNHCHSELKSIKDNLSDVMRSNILNWFSNSVDPSQNYNRAIKNRKSGTGQWFLESSEFIHWINTPSFMWLHGIPGSGKTVLCSTVIEAIKSICKISVDHRIAYFYFDFHEIDKQRTEPFLRSILRQLLAHESEFPEYVVTLYENLKTKGQSPTIEELEFALKFILETPDRETYLVLDALDEFPELSAAAERKEMLAIIANMAKKHISSLHILVASRDEPDIRESLERISHSSFYLRESVMNSDIAQYVQSRLSDPMERLSTLSESLKTEIESVINQGARGMFRWAVCQLDTLQQCRKARDIRDTLQRLPATLDQTYERILAGINKRDHPEALAILYWLTSSRRPLTLLEIAEAAIIKPNDRSFDLEDRLLHSSEVLSICGSLVTCSSGRKSTDDGQDSENIRFVRFAHYSVQEFLLSGRANHFSVTITASHNYILCSCLVYLQHLKTVSDTSMEQYPLLRYAAQFWFEHWDAAGEVDPLGKDLTYWLFHDEFSMHASKWLRIYEPCTNIGLSNLHLRRLKSYLFLSYPGPLYYAVYHGLYDVVKRLLESGISINEVHGFQLDYDLIFQHSNPEHVIYASSGPGNLAECRTALHLAVEKANKPLVELLLKFSADPNISATGVVLVPRSKDRLLVLEEFTRTLRLHTYTSAYALGDAVRNGHSGIVKLLLDHGAIPNVQTQDRPCLIHAAREGQLDIVLYLLNAKTDVNVRHRASRSKFDSTALIAACSKSHVHIVRLLIRFGADLNIVDTAYTALQMAVWNGNEKIVRTLLEAGADSDLVGQASGLEIPSSEVYGSNDEMLLDSSAHLRAARVGPLAMAAVRGNRIIAELLIVSGADVNLVPSPESPAPLAFASFQGDCHIVQLLLDAGANANAFLDGPSATMVLSYALLAAAFRGHSDVVQLLLDSSASVHPPTSHHQHAIATAARKGHNNAVRVLIEAGADVNAGNCIRQAAEAQYWTTVRMLLEAGAHVDVGAGIQRAAQAQDWTIVRLLLEANADVDVEGFIQQAAEAQKWTIVRLLLEAGATVNLEGCIQQAAEAQNWTIVRLLIKAGADVHAPAAQQTDLPSLFYAAASAGKYDIVQVLLDAGHDATRPYYAETPLQAAMKNGHVKVAKLLRNSNPIYTTSRTAYMDIMGRLKARREQITIESNIEEEETLLPIIGSNQTRVEDGASVM